jgi:hypothetical protein
MQTSGNGLRFYWNEHGTNTWHGEQVAANGTTFSGPSIAQDGNSVVIAAQGANNSLDFYWQPNGGSGWNMETVAGKGTTYFVPSIMQDGKSVIITVEGPGNSLYFYWAVNGSSTWTGEVVAGAGTTTSAPAIAVNDGSVNVVALNGNGIGTEFYWAANGTTTWHSEALPGFDAGAPAITTYPGGVHVVNDTLFGQLVDETTSNGTGAWQLNFVSGNEMATSFPAVTMNDGIENIASVGSDGNLYFYWEYLPGSTPPR